MKEDILQIAVDDGWLYALCKGGKIYRIDGAGRGSVVEPAWELVTEAPKIQYKKAV